MGNYCNYFYLLAIFYLMALTNPKDSHTTSVPTIPEIGSLKSTPKNEITNSGILRTMNGIRFGDIIGAGAYGVVCHCTHKSETNLDSTKLGRRAGVEPPLKITPLIVQSFLKPFIRIFNALGEEVAVLLDKELTTGTYEIEWNASSLPSGIYFYSLQAGDFIETKKMMLMK